MIPMSYDCTVDKIEEGSRFNLCSYPTCGLPANHKITAEYVKYSCDEHLDDITHIYNIVTNTLPREFTHLSSNP